MIKESNMIKDSNIDDDIKIIKEIGKGSFSNVFLCLKKDELDYFIIKKININELIKKYKEKNKKAKLIAKTEIEIEQEHEYYYNKLEEMIESEIEILTLLDHINIVQFYGYTKKRGIYYLHMEYCNGGDVYEYLKKDKNAKRNCFGGFSDRFMYEFIDQTSNGLKYLHDKNIIHRDIKLHNILMHKTESGIQFKISDFGFSCYDLSKLSRKETESDNLDKLSKKYFKLSGTPYYMAPEIILNMKKMENITTYKKNKIYNLCFYDKRIDIWSLGICIYELIFNLLPFSNIDNIKELERFYSMNTIQEIINKKVNKKIFLNTNLKILLLGMLQIRIKDRYTIDDVIKRSSDDLCIREENSSDSYSEIKYIKDIKENNYKLNEDMKQHIIKNPLSIMYSWEHINIDQCIDQCIDQYKHIDVANNNKTNLFVWIYNIFT
jgi:serine/threonine protein kinase